MANSKVSQLPVLDTTEIVATDMVTVLDKSATSGAGSGPGGTLKQMEAGGIGIFGSIAGVVRNVSLLGVNTNAELFTWAAQAINLHGPFIGAKGKDFIFKTTQVTGPPNNYSVTVYYFKLLSGRLIAGGPSDTILPPELVLAGGPFVVNGEVNADLFLEIGDAGAGPIHTYFNLGEDHIISGDPWVVEGQQFLTGILDGEPTIWLFLAGDGDWGGTSGNFTTAADFVNLSLQPPAVGFPLTKMHYLSLEGVDTNQPELKYIAEAVKARGPFTCMPGQQMVFKTASISISGDAGILMKRNYRLLPNVTSVGGVIDDTIVLPAWFMEDGDALQELDDSQIAELGDIGTDNVWDAFNEGNMGEAWDMEQYRFVRATQDAEIRLWAFVGMGQFYGGPDVGTTPAIIDSVEADFYLLTDQPPTVSDGNNIITLKTVLDDDLLALPTTVDAAGLAAYYNALTPGVMKQGYESWRIVIVDDTDAILKTFDLINRGKGLVGDGSTLLPLVAANFFEINVGGGTSGPDIDPDTDIYADVTALIADQGAQEEGEEYYVTDASAFTTVASGGALVLYLGTVVGDETDYLILSNPGGVVNELTSDELDAIQSAAAPTAGNPFATMDDIGSASFLYFTPEMYTGTDTAKINAAITAANATGILSLVVCDGEYYLDTAILLKSNVYLINNGLIKMNVGMKDNIVRAASTTTIDNIGIDGKGVFMGHSDGWGGYPATGVSGESWRAIGILFANVTNFRIGDINIQNTPMWGMCFEQCRYGIVGNPRILQDNTSANQDGINVRRGSHNITFGDIFGLTYDDTFAITNLTIGNDLNYLSTTIYEPGRTDFNIYQIEVNSINRPDVPSGSIGSFTPPVNYGGVLLLCEDGNKVHDVTIKTILGSAQVNVGFTSVPYWVTTQATVNDMYNIHISNVATAPVYLNRPIKNSSFINIPRKDITNTYDSGILQTGSLKVIKKYHDSEIIGTKYETFALSNEVGDLATGKVFEIILMRDYGTLVRFDFSVTTAPTGAPIIINVKKNGTTIYSTKPQIDISGVTTVLSATPAVLTGVTTFLDAHRLTVEIDQVGSAIKGKGLKAQMTYIN